MAVLPEPGQGKVETNLTLRVGKRACMHGDQSMQLAGGTGAHVVYVCAVDAKNLTPAHELKHSRDTYISIALDQEEVFRTATVEKSLR